MDSATTLSTVTCPVCSRQVSTSAINQHLDAGCRDVHTQGTSTSTPRPPPKLVAPIFNTPSKRVDSATPRPSTSKKRTAQAPDVKSSSQPNSSKRAKTTISARVDAAAPLAERVRPKSLDDFVGQLHLTGPDALLVNLIKRGATGSIIFWGPPGCGKTTLARLLAKSTDAVFKELSATVVGINDVRPIFDEAKNTLRLTGRYLRRTIIFLDEIHRFTKSQQDIFLPFLEQGHVQVCATTENPSFKLNSALISRCRVFVLERLKDEEITQVIKKAVERVSASALTASEGAAASSSIVVDVDAPTSSPNIPTSTDTPPQLTFSSQTTYSQAISSQDSASPAPLFPSYPQLTPRVLSTLTSLSTGDARTALSLLELVLLSPPTTPEPTLLSSLRGSVSASYDRTGDARYDLISALHKSVRGSQGSAALYWLARMLEAGEDPMYIARRMTVCASEDVGLADNHALPLAMATMQACQMIGMPECRINLAHLVSYLAEAPKSTRAYEGYKRAEAAAKLDLTIPVPMGMRNAPTGLMKELGYSEGYHYNPDYAHPVTNDYLPVQVRDDVLLRAEGDLTGKEWDEEALRKWEMEENGGKDWERRSS
ncbi:hypothetical protein EW146_g3145 [Bondarzewia mesenterica]|uniref:UBZ4-type domain-containing protein n=1 Tax=Bondarzewia mesenterica TaxID=1095465 RepID=A0A4S4LYG1_9AGAM|nr:hypothetical protein EW146_g3145 [Bondarzewia mesenterica]